MSVSLDHKEMTKVLISSNNVVGEKVERNFVDNYQALVSEKA